MTAGEEARLILTREDCLPVDEPITFNTLFLAFKRILKKYNGSIPDNLHLSLQAFEVLMQEGVNTEQPYSKVMEVLSRKIGQQVESVLDTNMKKMSEIVDNTVANQKAIQISTETLADAVESIHKLATDMGSNMKRPRLPRTS